MEENVVPLLSQWMENNPSSFNLGSFVQVFIQKVETLKKDSQQNAKFVNEISFIFTNYCFNSSYNIVVWHAYNLLFIMRNMIKYLIESLTEDNLIKNCRSNIEGEKNDETGSGMAENLLNALIEVIVDVKLT